MYLLLSPYIALTVYFLPDLAYKFFCTSYINSEVPGIILDISVHRVEVGGGGVTLLASTVGIVTQGNMT